ncbi:MAG: hypothetical protein ACRCZY_11575 [Phocaeicola sp.]
MMSDTKNYIELFASLRTAKQRGVPAPHKAILLLSVIDLVEYGVITTNRVKLSERLKQHFKGNWNRYVGRAVAFNPVIGTPFFHLHSEPFWRLIPFDGGEERIEELKKSNPYSVNKICENFRYAEIDKELFELMREESARAELRTTLIATYIQPQQRVKCVL